MRDKLYKHDAQVQIYPTTRGWTVRASYWDTIRPWTGHHFKKWVGLKEGPVNDHRRTSVMRAVEEAWDWLESELSS